MITLTQEEFKKKYGEVGFKTVADTNKSFLQKSLDTAKSFSTGVAKGALESSIGTARLLQGAGKLVMKGIDAIDPTDTFKNVDQTGVPSLSGQQATDIDAILKSENTAEKAGKLTAYVAELLTPSGSRKAVSTVAEKGLNIGKKGIDTVGDLAQPAIKAGKEVVGQIAKPENIMQRVARINPTEQVKFKDISGETVGEYLTKRKIFGNQEEITTQLIKNFQTNKAKADKAIATLKGQFKPTPVKTVLDDLFAKEKAISSPGALSPDIKRVLELKNKFNKSGLDMSEINEVKRLYERNVKLDFLKQNLPEGVKKANNLDSAVRKWQFAQAEKLGLKNLPELNKETQYSKMLADALGKKLAGSNANNAISLTDWVILAGGDPTAVASFIGKKLISSGGVQSKIAKQLSKGKKALDVSAQFGKAKPDMLDLLQKYSK
jgi:hypothetical protein